MVQSVYWVCLVIGGVFVAIATLGGLGDIDGDMSVDADGDLSAETEVTSDYQIDTDARLSQTSEVKQRSLKRNRKGTPWNFLTSLTSFKFWTVGGCFFGLTGVVLSWVQPNWSPLLVLGLAIGVGILCGGTLTFLLRKLQNRQADSLVRAENLAGLVGIVELPFDAQSKGKVRLTVRGTVLRQVAMTNDQRTFQQGDRVLVVGIEGGRLWVVSADDEGI
ncbi:MAG: hypothetical protein MUF49_29950 [Oculatellaceae cyanobacterium Prado106]|nr:hypothetical protein [Oculatellaceae cyanobacterium Prado106]